jgi:hypothetical protein
VRLGYNANKTEEEIISEIIGCYRIYNAGNKNWSFQVKGSKIYCLFFVT